MSRPDIDVLIRSCGLRRTASRVAVLRYIRANPAPVSHGEVYAALADHGLDRATVFRILKDFVKVGILARRDLGDHLWRFYLVSDTDS